MHEINRKTEMFSLHPVLTPCKIRIQPWLAFRDFEGSMGFKEVESFDPIYKDSAGGRQCCFDSMLPIDAAINFTFHVLLAEVPALLVSHSLWPQRPTPVSFCDH